MLKTLSILISATALATPAFADTVTHEGVTYIYSVKDRGNVTLITGEDATNHQPFSLRVTRNWVDGVVNGKSVSFSKRDVVQLTPAIIPSEIAAR